MHKHNSARPSRGEYRVDRIENAPLKTKPCGWNSYQDRIVHGRSQFRRAGEEPDLKFQISDFRFQISDLRFEMSDLRFEISDLRCQGIPITVRWALRKTARLRVLSHAKPWLRPFPEQISPSLNYAASNSAGSGASIRIDRLSTLRYPSC